MMPRYTRALVLLLTAVLLVAAAPAAAEPGKDPHGHSQNAPGQQKDRDYGHERGPEASPDPQNAEPTPHRLNLIVDGLSGIDGEFRRVVAAYLNAGFPVTIEPGPDLINNPADLDALLSLVDPSLLALPSPSAPELALSGTQTTSEGDCHLLILGVMEDAPFIDPIVRPECIPADVPLDDLGDRVPPIPLPGDDGGINLQINPRK